VVVDYSYLTDAIDTTLLGVDLAAQEWMPLGVFALAPSPDSEVEPVFYFQLALAKGGYISGTVYNASLDQTSEVDGTVDPQTQKVTWKLTNRDNSPVLETGVYDLTQPISPIKIYFEDGTSQTWYMIRQEQPT
jgi:hypothetical protein